MQLQAQGDTIGQRGQVQLVSGEYFTVLRQQAEYGRLLTPRDNDANGGTPAARTGASISATRPMWPGGR